MRLLAAVMSFAAAHEWCSLYDTCGKTSRFGSELPCPVSRPPEALKEESARLRLAELCGPELAAGNVCCTAEQVLQLEGELRRAEPILASCPACRQNFFDVFCQFTCSPHQAEFIEVLSNRTTMDGNDAVAELNYWLDPGLGDRIYDSCSDVKFSATNGRALDLVGGGATNRNDFFKFLGDEKPIGSPFQMNFPFSSKPHKPLKPQNYSEGWSCATGDLRCSCVDCGPACPSLEAPHEKGVHAYVALAVYIIVILIGILMWPRSHKPVPQLELERLIDDDEVDEDDPFALPGSASVPGPYTPNSALQTYLGKWGAFCARYPWVVVALGVLAAAVCALGLFSVELEVNPERLWVAPTSDAALNKRAFDEQFGPFYRTTQAYVVNDTGSVLDWNTLKWWASVEQRIAGLPSPILGDTLSDFCLQPVGDACAVTSVTGYFGGKAPPHDTWRKDLDTCTKSPVRCLPPFQQPLDPHLVLGTFNDTIWDSRALVTTWVLRNDADIIYQSRVDEWEHVVEEFFLSTVTAEAGDRGLRLSFSVESSLARELAKSSTTDVAVVVISYVVMGAYVSFALGQPSLGIVGLIIVILSVAASIGACTLAGYSLTLVTTEVIPFLTLAIGVDNIFLITHQLELVGTVAPHLGLEDRTGVALGMVGPSIVLSTVCELAALAVATRVGMPAVHNFAIYASVAILANSLLQLSVFVATTIIFDKSANESETSQPAVLSEYTPFLLKRPTKQSVLLVFVLWVGISLALIPSMQFGLDQRQAVPQDSFLVQYFTDVYDQLDVGPPVYFVVEEPGAEYRDAQLQLCSRFAPCSTSSVPNLIEQARKTPDMWLTGSPASWLDDFFQYLNPSLSACCPGCAPDWQWNMTGFPEGSNFTHLLDRWLESEPSEKCPLAGHAAYASAISRSAADDVVRAAHYRTSHVPLRSQNDYISAYAATQTLAEDISKQTGLYVFAYSVFYPFFSQYMTLASDVISLVSLALLSTFVLSTLLLGSIRTSAVVTVVVASMIINIAGLMVVFGISLNALSLVNLVICVGLGVEFCIHIARAFTFVPRVSPLGLRGSTRADRAYNALAGTGGSVLSGIAITKLIGVSVLAFAQSKIFVVYYFRQWVSLVLCATVHSLALLPVALSFWGGQAWLLEDSDLDLFADLEEL